MEWGRQGVQTRICIALARECLRLAGDRLEVLEVTAWGHSFAASCWGNESESAGNDNLGLSGGHQLLTIRGSTNHAPAGSRQLMSAGPMLLLVSLCKARSGLTSAARIE
jgi:hypothetical protein